MELDRRTFVTATAAAATMGLVGTVAAQATEAETPAHSWDVAPDPIEQFAREVEADVIVVGAGYAGLACCTSCAENGLNVVLIEKTPTLNGRTGQTGSVNAQVFQDAGVVYNEDDKEQIVRHWMAVCGSRAQADQVWTYVNRSGEAVDWLCEKVGRYGGTISMLRNQYHGAPYTEYLGNIRPSKAPEIPEEYLAIYGDSKSNNMYYLWQDAVNAGAKIDFEMRAVQLIREEDGSVHSVVAADSDGNYVKYTGAKGVVLATGDIGGDDELCSVYAPDMLRCKNQYTPAGANTGDGLKMGMWIGAKIEEAPFAQMLHPVAYCRLSHYFLHVNTLGKRFMNEDTWVQGKSMAILRTAGNSDHAWGIMHGNWEQETAEAYPLGGGLFWGESSAELGTEWTPDYDRGLLETAIEQGMAFEAQTLQELGEKIAAEEPNFSVDEFVKTVDRYNELCEAGRDVDYGKRPEMLYKLDTPPFYAFKTGPGRMVAPGGLMVNPRSEVLDTNDNPIPGLYAIGNVSGGLYAVDYPVVCNANSMGRCLTFGYLVGRQLAGIE